MHNYSKILALFGLVIFATACSVSPRNQDVMLVGGATGGAVGAGTGAIIGASIARGNVAKSALVGGAIGIPAGVGAGLLYDYAKIQGAIDSNDEAIRANQEEIRRTQADLDEYREKLDGENSEIKVDSSRGRYRYIGSSLGNPYR